MSGIRPLGICSAKQSALLQPPGKHLCRTQKLFAAAAKSGDQEQTYLHCQLGAAPLAKVEWLMRHTPHTRYIQPTSHSTMAGETIVDMRIERPPKGENGSLGRFFFFLIIFFEITHFIDIRSIFFLVVRQVIKERVITLHYV